MGLGRLVAVFQISGGGLEQVEQVEQAERVEQDDVDLLAWGCGRAGGGV